MARRHGIRFALAALLTISACSNAGNQPAELSTPGSSSTSTAVEGPDSSVTSTSMTPTTATTVASENTTTTAEERPDSETPTSDTPTDEASQESVPDFDAEQVIDVFDAYIAAEVEYFNLIADGTGSVDDARSFHDHFDPEMFAFPAERRAEALWECSVSFEILKREVVTTHMEQIVLADGVWLLRAALTSRVDRQPPTSVGVEFVVTPEGFGGYIRENKDECGYTQSARGEELRQLALSVVDKKLKAQQLDSPPPVPITANDAMSIMDKHLVMERALADGIRAGTADLALALRYHKTRDISLFVGHSDFNAHAALTCFISDKEAPGGVLASTTFELTAAHVDQLQVNESTWLVTMRIELRTDVGTSVNSFERLVTSNGVGPGADPTLDGGCGAVNNERGDALQEELQRVGGLTPDN